jgi:hyperosmotically inducible periplasmic protein
MRHRFNTKKRLAGVVLAIGLYNLAAAQDGPVLPRVREGAARVAGAVERTIDQIRGDVQGMGIQARVMSRLRWDKALTDANIDVDVEAGDAVILKGAVASAGARSKAIELAQDTVGVSRVIADNLVVAQNQPGVQPTPGRPVVPGAR